MKKLISLMLVGVVVVTMLPEGPAKAQSTNQPPDSLVPLVCGMVVLAVGAIVVWNLTKLCKKINTQDSRPDGATNDPPPRAEWVLPPDRTINGGATLTMDDSSGVVYWDCSSNGWTDPVSNVPVTAMLQGRLQSSGDVKTWSDECTLLGWASQNGITLVTYRNGSPLATNYVATGQTTALRILPDSTTAPAKFYRWTAP